MKKADAVAKPISPPDRQVVGLRSTRIVSQAGRLPSRRLCRRGRQAIRANPRGKPGFSTFESGCGRETDCLREGSGFELSIPLASGAHSLRSRGLVDEAK